MTNFTYHNVEGTSIAELKPNGVVLSTTQQFLQMMMNAAAEGIIVHQESIDKKFFNLASGLAGDMLQKVVNYRLKLAIVGDFSAYDSISLKAFIYESNRSNHIAFVETVSEALAKLGKGG